MAVTLDDVRHVAALARLGLSNGQAEALVGELNTILAHMHVLSKIDTSGIEEVVGVGAVGAPLRRDAGPPVPLARPIETFAPRTDGGFFLVPRLSTHDKAEES